MSIYHLHYRQEGHQSLLRMNPRHLTDFQRTRYFHYSSSFHQLLLIRRHDLRSIQVSLSEYQWVSNKYISAYKLNDSILTLTEPYIKSGLARSVLVLPHPDIMQTGPFSAFVFAILNFFEGRHAGAEFLEYSISVSVRSIAISFNVFALSQPNMVFYLSKVQFL